MTRPPKHRTRTASRVAAVQALFQAEQAGDNAETVIDQFVRHRLGQLEGQDGFEDGRIPDAEVPLFSRVVREAVRRQDVIDPLLVEALPDDWPLARIDPVLRALMRAGAAELSMTDGPPAKVVINEYPGHCPWLLFRPGTGARERGARSAGEVFAAFRVLEPRQSPHRTTGLWSAAASRRRFWLGRCDWPV